MDARFGPFSECAKEHVAVKPQKGEALAILDSQATERCGKRYSA